MKKFAEISWCADDVMYKYDITKEEAEKLLDKCSEDIQVAMINAGFEVIREYAEERGFKEKASDA